jgi:hypothetical protein
MPSRRVRLLEHSWCSSRRCSYTYPFQLTQREPLSSTFSRAQSIQLCSHLKCTRLQALCIRRRSSCLPRPKIEMQAASDRALAYVYKRLAQPSQFSHLSCCLPPLHPPPCCLLSSFGPSFLSNTSLLSACLEPLTSWPQTLLTIPHCSFALKY